VGKTLTLTRTRDSQPGQFKWCRTITRSPCAALVPVAAQI
jgi:hypothetical protein